jgi:hypothetical protein
VLHARSRRTGSSPHARRGRRGTSRRTKGPLVSRREKREARQHCRRSFEEPVHGVPRRSTAQRIDVPSRRPHSVPEHFIEFARLYRRAFASWMSDALECRECQCVRLSHTCMNARLDRLRHSESLRESRESQSKSVWQTTGPRRDVCCVGSAERGPGRARMDARRAPRRRSMLHLQ